MSNVNAKISTPFQLHCEEVEQMEKTAASDFTLKQYSRLIELKDKFQNMRNNVFPGHKEDPAEVLDALKRSNAMLREHGHLVREYA